MRGRANFYFDPPSVHPGQWMRRMDIHVKEQRRADAADDDEVLTFKEWAKLNKFSERTGRRILKAPGGPTVTLLSKRRFGITRRNNRVWQKSRERV